VRCDTIDAQVGELFGSLVLPADWRSEIERRVADYDRLRSVEQERAVLADRLRRRTTAYTLGNVDDDDYKRQQAELKRAMAGLRLPEVEEAVTAGDLLADLRTLWRRATLDERHELLKGMVAKVYVDLVSRRIIGVTPKPGFWSLFEQVRVEHPRMLLLAPDEVKRRLAEPQAAAVVLVETGENRTPRPARVRPRYPTRVGDALKLA
jgi:site-specific DNA recombinase